MRFDGFLITRDGHMNIILEISATQPVSYFNNDRVIQYLQTIGGISAQLLGVAVTVAALVPALVTTMHTDDNGYFGQRQSKIQLQRLLIGTIGSIVSCSIALIASMVGQLCFHPVWLVVDTVFLGLGIVFLIAASIGSVISAFGSIRKGL